MQGAMTARPTAADEATVPHHCYACVDMMDSPDAQTFNVQKYRELALGAISDVHGRGNVPIVCGGTNYYIEALLFDESVQHQYEANGEVAEFDADRFRESFDNRCAEFTDEPKWNDLLAAFRHNIPIDNKQEIEDNFESALCHSLLSRVEPSMATYLHFNDKRKIVNALFKSFKQAGQESLASQSAITSGQTGLKLRFRPIIIWICADKDVLEQRIRKRVDKMIDQEDGLTEIFHIFDSFTNNGTDLDRHLDFSKGILQSIGYKEFYDYYIGQRKQTEDAPTLASAKERLCSKTLQYAQYQMKWLRKRILPIFKADLEGKHNLMH